MTSTDAVAMDLIAAPYSPAQQRVTVNPVRFGGTMTTGAVRQRIRRFDKFFFSGMAVAILATVFLGSARTYYLAGVFSAWLPNLLIHIHGAVFSSWILLLIAQTFAFRDRCKAAGLSP